VGLDVGDRTSVAWILDEAGNPAWSGKVLTKTGAMERHFGGRPRIRIVLEAGTHAHWLTRALEALGHEVIMVNPRRLELVTKNERKSDMRDARILANMGHADTSLKLLSPVRPKTAQQIADRSVITLRRALVASRTSLVLSVRGVVKATGDRLPHRSPESFHKLDLSRLQAELIPTVSAVMQAIFRLNKQIKKLDRAIESMSEDRYPVTSLLRQVSGVGPITSMLFVLIIGDPRLFKKSREAGAFVGLVPRRHQSGASEPQLRVTKTGDRLLRSHLVQCAHYILGHHGPDSDLKRFGQRIIDRGGRYPKRRAVVAVARKLAVLLHSLWMSAEVYEPLRHSNDPVAMAG
jgi:transposase